ncbi:class I SAM-dependent methyltransferase [Streptomyces sp. NBC_01275]|uniref:class I SAM-dependent methyltransferase n=1 Tax=Streptomyces sp. NBC_01275 TaxID=2903807 RepID=UPI00225521E3|nr:class I SAM-dependent methyltransferase [Streptomyces sp. NBC_01275]MCX4764583.1 class I SAM-dependent methyltransferase [Streptomyces sp. NBC_01275]
MFPESPAFPGVSAAPDEGSVVVADDRLRAAAAHRLACAGTSLLWRGDFHNGRQLLAAMKRRTDRTDGRQASAVGSLADAFRRERRARARRAQVLDRLLVELTDDYTVALRRAPDVREACRAAYGPPAGTSTVPLRELLGVIGAHQWRLKGVEVPALGDRIHPHYGVFAPVRGEYVDLVAQAPLPPAVRADPGGAVAFDLGVGTGVLAAVLARRGVGRVVATDANPRALACAEDNARRLGLGGRIEVAASPGLYPTNRADLVVCNPPWLPGRAVAALEMGVYDEDGAMLRGFLAGLVEHLRPGGEGWLVLSDLAEHLGLRTRAELLELIETAGLRVVGTADARPRHRRARDASDPLHAARAAETTSLWRLSPTPQVERQPLHGPE